MRICAGVITWRDGDDLLARCLNSVGEHVQEIVFVDGLIAGVDTDLPAWTDLSRFEQAGVHVERVYGATQARKRTILLGAARRLRCDWLLQLDADERLENAALIRPTLKAWPLQADYFPIPFRYDDEVLRPLGWKCLRVNRWRECAARNGYMVDRHGRLRHTSSLDTVNPSVLAQLPWISHHPDERQGSRAAIRLGAIEHHLEPIPAGAVDELGPVNFHAPRLLQPAGDIPHLGGSATMSTAEQQQEFYCPQCGARYGGPGQCENGHPPCDVQPLTAAAAAETGQDDPTVPTDPAKDSSASQQGGSGDSGATSTAAAASATVSSGPETAAPTPEPAAAVDHLAAAEGHMQAAIAELDSYRQAQTQAAG